MDRKQSKNSAATWILIDAVFVVVIIVLLVLFLMGSHKRAVNQAQSRVETYVNVWSETLSRGASGALSFGKSVKEYTDLTGKKGTDKDTISYIKSYVDYSDISHVLVCNGNSVISDENGNIYPDYDLGFSKKSSEVEYVYLENGPFGETYDYLAVYYPLGDGDYLLIYTSLNTIGNSFSYSDFDSTAFLGIIGLNGETVCSFDKYKDNDSVYLSSANMFNTIEYSAKKKTEYDTFKAKVRRGSVGLVQTDYSGDNRTIAAVNISVGNNNWSLVYGVRQETIDRLVESYVEDSVFAVIKLAIVIVAFSIFVVATVIINTVKNNEHGRELEDKADTDLLTDLYNKAATERKIQEYLESNPNSRGLMFILDIDNFKKINDTMGHAFGDTLLKTLGKEIKAEFRVSDIIGRTGGDEFMVFLKNVNDDVIVEREANRITRFFHNFKAGGDYVKYSATASIGAAIFPDDAKTFKELYVAADTALYKAKKRGKNQLVFFNEGNENDKN